MHKNNFDFMRLLFASFVIITHSYALTGLVECDLLCQITNGQLKFSEVGLDGFFIISGYLIYQSLIRSKGLTDFFWRRILRVYPALIVVLSLTIMLLPLVYENTKTDFFHNKDIRNYIPKNLSLYYQQFTISGVFEKNPQKIINGSLWTIEYEFAMYIIIAGLFYFRKSEKLALTILILTFALFAGSTLFYKDLFRQSTGFINFSSLFNLGSYFIAGSILAAIKVEKFKTQNLILVISSLAFVVSLILGFNDLVKVFLLPLIVICFSIKSTPSLSGISNKIGDLSYGLYIYAFPIQQTLLHFLKISTLQLMGLSFVVAIPFAYLSWHLIESPALKLKYNNPANYLKRLFPITYTAK